MTNFFDSLPLTTPLRHTNQMKNLPTSRLHDDDKDAKS